MRAERVPDPAGALAGDRALRALPLRGEAALSRGVLVTAAAIIAWLLLHLVPVPGLLDSSFPLGGDGGSMAFWTIVGPELLPGVSIMLIGLWPLVLMRGLVALALDPEDGSSWLPPWGAFVIYVAICSFVAWRTMPTLQSAELMIIDFGTGTAWAAAGSIVGGSVLLWGLAGLMSELGGGHGTLTLVLTSVGLSGVDALFTGGAILEGGVDAPTVQLMAALVLSVVVVLGAAAYRPPRLPRHMLRGFFVRTPADLVALPLVALAAVPATLLWLLPEATQLSVYTVLEYLGVGGCLAIAIVVAVWIVRPGPEPQQEASEPPSRRPWVAGVVGAPLAAGVLIWSGALAVAPPEPELAGDDPWSAVVACEGDAVADAHVIATRLERLGLGVTVKSIGAGRIDLALAAGGDPAEAVAGAMAPGRFAIALIEEFRRFQGPEPGALLPEIEQTGLPGVRFGVECQVDALSREETCYAHTLSAEPRASLSNVHVAGAEVLFDDRGPYVSVEMTPQGAVLFEELTRRAVGRYLAIMVDQWVYSAPVVEEPIAGGRARITLGRGASPTELLEEARTLANLVGTQGLSGVCRLESLSPGR